MFQWDRLGNTTVIHPSSTACAGCECQVKQESSPQTVPSFYSSYKEGLEGLTSVRQCWTMSVLR